MRTRARRHRVALAEMDAVRTERERGFDVVVHDEGRRQRTEPGAARDNVCGRPP